MCCGFTVSRSCFSATLCRLVETQHDTRQEVTAPPRAQFVKCGAESVSAARCVCAGVLQGWEKQLIEVLWNVSPQGGLARRWLQLTGWRQPRAWRVCYACVVSLAPLVSLQQAPCAAANQPGMSGRC
jgi:hypothetical protein